MKSKLSFAQHELETYSVILKFENDFLLQLLSWVRAKKGLREGILLIENLNKSNQDENKAKHLIGDGNQIFDHFQLNLGNKMNEIFLKSDYTFNSIIHSKTFYSTFADLYNSINNKKMNHGKDELLLFMTLSYKINYFLNKNI